MKKKCSPTRPGRVPQSVWLAVYSCGAFRFSLTESGVVRTASSHQHACCGEGGHPFEIIEYTKPSAPAAPAPQPVARPGPLQMPSMLMRRLHDRVARCTRCSLAQSRQHTVFSRGNLEAQVCFVGEAPGAEEDSQGKPFVGRSGRLLDEMIQQMGLSPDRDVYICNIIKCRPPSNRRPTPDEIAACSDHLHEQLSLWRQSSIYSSDAGRHDKRILVALGKTAIDTLLGTRASVHALRGQWKLYRGRIMLMPTYHPSFLLRPFATQDRCRQEAASDLLLVAKELGLVAPTPKARRPKLYAISGGRDAEPGSSS